jgi:hypothetical protein
MSRPARVALLAITGLVSGLLTVAIQAYFAFGPFCAGLVFGVSLGAYFVVSERVRPVSLAAAFLVASTAAYLISLWALFYAWSFSVWIRGIHTDAIELSPPLLFVGGWAGAVIVLAAGLVLFGPGAALTVRSLGRLALWGLVGALLGPLGCACDSLLMRLMPALRSWNPEGSPAFSVHVGWQTGVALSLGLLLSRESRR